MGVSLDFASPLPFSSAAKKSAFKPIRFNQSTKNCHPIQDATLAAEKVALTNDRKDLAITVANETEHIQSTASLSKPIAVVNSTEPPNIVQASVEVECQQNASAIEKAIPENFSTVLDKEKQDKVLQGCDTFLNEDTPEKFFELLELKSEANVVSEKLDQACTELARKETVVEKPAILLPEVVVETKPLVIDVRIEHEPTEEPFPYENGRASNGKFAMTQETTSAAAEVALYRELDENSSSSTSSLNQKAASSNHASSPLNKRLIPELDQLTADDPSDSIASDGGGERPYTDDDMDDTESIENFLEVNDTNCEQESTADDNAVQLSQLKFCSSDQNAQTNKSTAITNSNLFKSEGN